MKRIAVILILMGSVATQLHAQLFPKLGAQRAGISAMTFLKIDVSPRAAGMGGAQVAVNGDPYAAYWNPAALTDLDGLSLAGANTFWVAGINHAFITGSKPFKFGTLGLSVTQLSSGAMERRTEFQPDGTGEYFYATNLAVGLTYSKQLTTKFSWGITAKYVNEQLAEYKAHTGMIDLGFLYRTDWKDLKFAVLLQNFGVNSKLKGDYTPDQINQKPVQLEDYPAPTVFSLGVSMIPWKREHHQLMTTVQLNHPNDNAENIRIGLEYEYRKFLYFRGGYKLNVRDQNYPTAGVGLKIRVGGSPVQMDYSVDPTKYLGWIHRIGLSFSLNRQERDAQ